MGPTAVLARVYVTLYLLVGATAVAFHQLGFALAVWLPFGALALVFRAALADPGWFGRLVAAGLSGAIAGLSLVGAIWAPLMLADELDALAADASEPPAIVVAALTALVWPLVTAALYRGLAPGRRRDGLVAVLALPSALTGLAALVAVVCMVLTPPGFLNGIGAIMVLAWAALAGVFLAGGWLTVVALRRHEPLEPPAPPRAVVVRG